jgi:uncharacterized protein YggE
MYGKQAIAAFALLAGSVATHAQLTSQPQLKIEPTNRTLTVNAEERVTADPDFAILHIGFETQPADAKAAYAAGAKASNEIVAALKQAGVEGGSIRSEGQHLERVQYDKPHKFKLVQQWTVKTPQDRAAEILDIVIAAGATESGDIDWAVKDEQALEEQALDHAASQAKANAVELAKSMGVHLGALIYVSNQISAPEVRPRAVNGNSVLRMEMLSPGASTEKARASAPPPPLAIEPRKVARTASVYAVYVIE